MDDNTDLPLKLMPTAEIERHLDRVENLLDESLGLDDGARADLMETRHYLVQELKRRQYRVLVDSQRIPEPIPKPLCAHKGCGLPATSIDVGDEHSDTASVFYVREFCSLNCFACALKHAWDGKNSDRFREILRRIGS